MCVCINSRRQVAVAIKFCRLAPKISGSSIWNPLHVTNMVPRILMGVRFYFENYCTRVPKGPYSEQTRLHRPRQSFPLYPTHKNPKDQTLTLLHPKECLCPELFITSKPRMLKYYRVSELCAFTGFLTVCQPVMLPE